jgi:PAS domain S-box-containing protein
MEKPPSVAIEAVVDSLSDGVYVCDLDRTITYWSKSAERITGWSAEDVVGRKCLDDVLCHVDKDGHRLCGEEYCPLHRSMTTGSESKSSLLVYARGKDGRRIPMLVGVAPIRDSAGRIIGGVETFRDASRMVHDLERAQAIQQLALLHDVPEDPRVTFTAHYVPHEIVGGDYYAIEKLDDSQYGLMLADVMGHGVAAALYTMHLSSLWNRYHRLLASPAEFARNVNNELAKVVHDDGSFATAACGCLDLENRVFRLAGAGCPPVLQMHADGTHEFLECPGLPLAVMDGYDYEERVIDIHEGDRLLLFSDGATEIHNADDEMLDIDGLLRILRDQGYPESDIDMASLEEELLRYSNSIRLEDDLTFVDVRCQDLKAGTYA